MILISTILIIDKDMFLAGNLTPRKLTGLGTVKDRCRDQLPMISLFALSTSLCN